MSTFTKLKAAISIFLAATLSLTLTACSPSGYGTDSQPKTSKYLFDKFVEGQYLDPFDSGTGDLGTTMESMAHLSAVGYDKTKQAKAIEWLIANSDKISSAGLLGEYVFTAHALGFSSDPTVSKALGNLRKLIKPDFSVVLTNNFSDCWVVLGLLAAEDTVTANAVAMKLSTFVEVTGGFKYIFGDTGSAEAADVTGFVILALQATDGLGNSEQEAAKAFIINKAKTFLVETDDVDEYWSSFGEYDISGTAYAAMGLRSIGVDVSKYTNWLKSKINANDGGVVASWTAPDSDLFSTSQSVLALNGYTFIDVLKHKAD